MNTLRPFCQTQILAEDLNKLNGSPDFHRELCICDQETRDFTLVE